MKPSKILLFVVCILLNVLKCRSCLWLNVEYSADEKLYDRPNCMGKRQEYMNKKKFQGLLTDKQFEQAMKYISENKHYDVVRHLNTPRASFLDVQIQKWETLKKLKLCKGFDKSEVFGCENIDDYRFEEVRKEAIEVYKDNLKEMEFQIQDPLYCEQYKVELQKIEEKLFSQRLAFLDEIFERKFKNEKYNRMKKGYRLMVQYEMKGDSDKAHDQEYEMWGAFLRDYEMFHVQLNIILLIRVVESITFDDFKNSVDAEKKDFYSDKEVFEVTKNLFVQELEKKKIDFEFEDEPDNKPPETKTQNTNSPDTNSSGTN